MSFLEAVDRFDERVDAAADSLRGNPTVDRAFYSITEAANHSLSWHAINLAANVPQWPRNRRNALSIALTLGAESALINGVVKQLFKRARPTHVGDRPHKLRKPKTSSFPSGHATSAFCAVALLTNGRPKGVKAAGYVLATAVSYSRIHVRLHHASDVLGGIAIGTVLGKVAKRAASLD